jgi:hypothetical protein
LSGFSENLGENLRGEVLAATGGGWYEVLSGLKTLLETGAQLPFQSGPQKGCEQAA